MMPDLLSQFWDFIYLFLKILYVSFSSYTKFTINHIFFFTYHLQSDLVFTTWKTGLAHFTQAVVSQFSISVYQYLNACFVLYFNYQSGFDAPNVSRRGL